MERQFSRYYVSESLASLDVVCNDLNDGVRYVGEFVNDIFTVSNALLMLSAAVIVLVVEAQLLQLCCLCSVILCRMGCPL